MQRTALVLIALLAPLPLHGQAGNGAQPSQKGILARAIRLEEEPEEKRGPFPMPFGTSPQDVDVNSTIHVRISRDELLAGLSGNPALTPAAQEAALLVQGAAQLRQAEGFLKRAIDDAEELARLDLAGQRESPQFEEIANADQEGLRATFQLLNAHLAALLASPNAELRQHATEARARMSDAVDIGRPALAAVIVEEIRWLLERLETVRVKVDEVAPPLALILSASHVRPGGETEVGLVNYNDLPIGTPMRIDKLSLVLPPDQVALHGEAAALAAELNRLRQEGAGLVELARRILAAEGLDLDPLEDALDQVKEDADRLRETDWSRAADELEDRVRAAIAEATGAQRQRLEAVLPAVLALKERARELRSLAGLASSVRGLRAQLDATAGQDPTTRLLGVLSLLQMGSQLASGDLKGWQKDVEALRKQLGVVRELADLPEEVKDDLAAILSDTAVGQLGDLATHLQELRAAADGLRERFRKLSAEIKGVPALAVALHREPPATAFRVAFPEIKDTWVDIQTLNPRSEDDVLVIRAWLYRMKPDPGDPTRMIEDEELDSDLQQLRMLRFGWYATPAVGLVYLRSQNELIQEGEGDDEAAEPESARMFAPQVSWLYRHRAWQEAGDPANPRPFRDHSRWWHSVGVGLHTVSMDLDNDNQQELGLGLSVSFFKDFLQIGAGWDLSLDDEPYFFVGTRLLEFAKNLGVGNKPAAPEE
jgi:hypothetical protein